MNTGLASVVVGNGGSSSSFSNLSPLAPPFTLDRSLTKPISTPLIDMAEPSFGVGVPLNSSLPNSSQAILEPSDNRGPLFGRFTISSTDPSFHGDSSNAPTSSFAKTKPYYPSYASTSCNNGCPMLIVDQPTYDWLSNSHVAAPPCMDFSLGSSGSERSVEQASHSIEMLDLNKCNEFVLEYPNEELLLDQNFNIEPVNNLRISSMDAHSAFPGCHPKTRTPPSNSAISSRNCQFLKNPPYQEILREQDARLSVTTSTVNSPATFSIRPPVVSTDSFVWNVGPCHISDYGYDSFEGKQGGNDLSNLNDFLPVNNESKVFFSTQNHGLCIDKNDPVITESSSTKIHGLPNNVHSAMYSPDPILKTGMGIHSPDASPHFSLDLKTIETPTAIESSSENFDQYNLAAVDSPCWKGAQAFEIATRRVKKVEVCGSVNLSLPQVHPSTDEDTVKLFVQEQNESTTGGSLEKCATSSPKMPSVAVSSWPSAQKTSDSVKRGDFYSKMDCFHRAIYNIQESVEDGGDFYSSCSMPQNNYKRNLMSGKRIAPSSCMEKHADTRLNRGNSSEDGLNNFSCDVAEHVQNLPSELVKAFHGESISKIDIRTLVDTLHGLSEVLLTYCSNGSDALHQKDVESLETVMNNLDMCLNSVGSQGSITPEQRISQNLGQFHQLHSDVGVLKSQSQMTKIEGKNLGCLSNDRNDVEEKNQYILSVKKGNEAADSLYLRNGIDSIKEDSMTKALMKVLSENIYNEEHPQSLLYKNLWLEAEAALCASNLRARFNSAKLEMEKHESSKLREHAKNRDELLVSNVSPGSNNTVKLAPKTKVGSTSFVSVQTSPAVTVSSHAADDIITRFQIPKCRDDEAKPGDAENLGTLSDFEVSVEQDIIERLALDKKQTAVPCIKDMASSKVIEQPAFSPTALTLTRSNQIDDVMSRFQILKSREERRSCVNARKVQKVSSSNCREDMSAPRSGTVHSPGISMKHHPIKDNKNEVDNLDASVVARLDVLTSRGNNIRSTLAGEQLQEVEHQYPASKGEYWPIIESKVKKAGSLGADMEPFLRLEPGVLEGKLPAGCCSDGSTSDWEHVLWGE